MTVHVCLSVVHLFLVADTQLYNRLCPSVRQSIHLSILHESKSGKTSILGGFLVMSTVGEGGGAWDVDGGWMPLPTHLQRYFDPVPLVPLISEGERERERERERDSD